jgi:hypothetical protein
LNFVNQAPFFNPLANVSIPVGSNLNINLNNISIGSGEIGQSLAISVTSNTINIVPNPIVTYSFPNTNGSLRIIGQSVGTAIIRVRMQDDGGTANGGVDVLERTFTVSVFNPIPPPQPQTITVEAINDKIFGIPPFVAKGKASSGLPLKWIVNSGNALINNDSMITITGTGIVNLCATQNGNTAFMPATPVCISFNVLKAPQNIQFDSIPDKVWNDFAFPLSAQATSHLPISFEIVSGGAFLQNNLVNLQSQIGEVTIRALQNGNQNYLPATPVLRKFKVGKAKQQINFASLGNYTFGDAPFQVFAQSTSGLPITLSVKNGKATIQNQVVTLTGAGTITLLATQNGNDLYLPTSSEVTFQVAKASQQIRFDEIISQNIENQKVELKAISSSSLPIRFEIVRGIATVNSNSLIFNNSGWIVIRALQEGNEDYLPATPVERSVWISPSIRVESVSKQNLCSDEALTVRFATQGSFESNNVFAINLFDIQRNTTIFLGTTTAKEFNVNLQNFNLLASNYKVIVQSTAPEVYSSAFSNELVITPIPQKPLIRFENGFLVTRSQSNIYQWFLNNVAISNTNQNSLKPTQNGVYQVQIGSGNCISISEPYTYVITSVENDEKQDLEVYPNPSNDKFYLKLPPFIRQTVTLTLQDMLGKTIWKKTIQATPFYEINADALPNGAYLLRIENFDNQYIKKIIKGFE